MMPWPFLDSGLNMRPLERAPCCRHSPSTLFLEVAWKGPQQTRITHEFVSSVLRPAPAASAFKRLCSKIRSMSRG